MPEVVLVNGSLRRVCQLTGEHDRTRGEYVPSRTFSCFGLVGTDLGASVDLGDRQVFLFGDTWPDPKLGDSLAWTTETIPTESLALTFQTGPTGRWQQFELIDSQVPGRTTGVFEVPTGGFARNGRLYVIYSQKQQIVGMENEVMTSSIMCRADSPATLTQLSVLYELSRLDKGGRFINAAPVCRPATPAEPAMLYVWGSGRYRNSWVYLARVPLDAVDDPSMSQWRYWTGVDWVADQSKATPLFKDQPALVGELSAAWVTPLGRWLITYQLNPPAPGVWFRTAPDPIGPYSSPRLLFHPDWPDVGYGAVFHRYWDLGGVFGTDPLYDRGRGEEGAGPYGPYLVDRFIRADGPNRARIAFVLSTWNPYQSHLFEATLGLANNEPPQTPALPFVPAPPPPTTADGVVVVRSTFGPGNYELLAPAADGGMLFRYRDNAQSSLPWSGVARVGLGPGGAGHPVCYGAVSMIQSDLPLRPEFTIPLTGRLYVAARCGDRVVYLWRDPGPPWNWHGPYPVIAVETDDRRVPFEGATGNVVLIRSHHGALHHNWELVAPAAAGGGLIHYWRDNDPQFPLLGDWRLAPRALTGIGQIDAVTIIEAEITANAFSLEVVARVGGRLWCAWRDANLQWYGPIDVLVDGSPVTDAAGVPSLIQSSYGAKARNFELVTPLKGGGLLHLWRNNDADDPQDWRWGRAAAVIDPGRHYTTSSLLQGKFGAPPGNLELVARADDGKVMHFWRESASLQWSGPNPVLYLP